MFHLGDLRFGAVRSMLARPLVPRVSINEFDTYFHPDQVNLYQKSLEIRGLEKLFPIALAFAKSTQVIQGDLLLYASNQLREVVERNITSRKRNHKAIALHDGVGKSGEAFWRKFMIDLIPESLEVNYDNYAYTNHENLLRFLGENKDYDIYAFDDMILSGIQIRNLLHSASYDRKKKRLVEEWGNRHTYIAAIMGSSLFREIQPAFLHKFKVFTSLRALTLEELFPGINLVDVSQSFFYPRNDTCNREIPLIIDSINPDWCKAPDNNPKLYSEYGVYTSSFTKDYFLLDTALLQNLTFWKPFYKSEEYAKKRQVERMNGIGRPVNA